MTYRGTVRNGVVVFKGARRPTEGTAVEVRPAAPAGRKPAGGPKGSKRSKPATHRAKRGGDGRNGQSSVDRIAREQGITRITPFDDLLGGWPDGQEDDGFEQAVATWRAEEPRRGEF